MPYLRMFLEGKQIDEVFIANHLMQSLSGWNIIDEEKKKLMEKHCHLIKNTATTPSFCLDSVSSAINSFVPLTQQKNSA